MNVNMNLRLVVIVGVDYYFINFFYVLFFVENVICYCIKNLMEGMRDSEWCKVWILQNIF